MRPIINRLGYAKSTPHAILYGPQLLGGTGRRPFHDEQGSSKVELVLKHSRANTMVTTQLHITLAWCQRMSGISHPILEAPSILLPHLETSFLPSLRVYLSDTQSALVLETSHIPPLQLAGDFHLMDRESANISNDRRSASLITADSFSKFTRSQTSQWKGGTHVDLCFIEGRPSLLSSTSKDVEIHQERPNTQEYWTYERYEAINLVQVKLNLDCRSFSIPASTKESFRKLTSIN
jgi:hypothetical protein